jgi:hypothetical protein
MEVTYSTTRSDQWRCHLYVMFHRGQSVFGFVFTPAMLALVYIYSMPPMQRNMRGLLIALLAAFGGWAAFHGLILHAMILKRLPTPTTRRVCTTLITPEFFRDTVPEKVMEYPWAQISDIRLHDGDFYFWLGGTKGNFIPRSAFDNPREGQHFYETAMAYWHSAKSGSPVPQDGEVWPPPPRLG